MKKACLLLAWGSMAVAIVGFYQPWATVDLRELGMVQQLREVSGLQETLGGLKKDLGRIAVKIRRGAETITGDLPSLADIPKQVSGAEIPQMANQEKAKVAMALVELFTHTRQRIGLKSYAVYLVPGLVLLCAVLLTFAGARPVAWGVALLCTGIAGAGFLKLLTTNTQTLFVAITIGRGLWLSLWAYVGLAVAAALSALGSDLDLHLNQRSRSDPDVEIDSASRRSL